MKFGCPYCHTFCERDESSHESIITCPNCGQDFQIREPPLLPLSSQDSPRPKRRGWSFVALIVAAALGWAIVSNLADNRYQHEKDMAERQRQIAELEKDKATDVAILGVVGGAIAAVSGIIVAIIKSGSSEDY